MTWVLQVMTDSDDILTLTFGINVIALSGAYSINRFYMQSVINLIPLVNLLQTKFKSRASRPLQNKNS